jgi:anti-anti-sigma factor
MLLNLQKQGNAHVLEVSGDVDAKGAAILRAGITKLMKSGKDRIIVDFSKAGSIDSTAIRKLGELVELASELMGKIVAAGKELKNAKQLSAAIPLLPSVKEAIDYLNQATYRGNFTTARCFDSRERRKNPSLRKSSFTI